VSGPATPRPAPTVKAGAGGAPVTRSRTPTPLSELVSAQMQRMPRSSTSPEITLRQHLHRLGMRFRLHPRQLPGRPDIALTRARIAIFVDGCFWHACPSHGSLPKNNREWWRDKLAANVARDRAKDVELQALGWLPHHVWEHEEPAAAANAIRDLWMARRAQPTRRGR
jgi:DNA mismatch endonuclease (patch repair protein)